MPNKNRCNIIEGACKKKLWGIGKCFNWERKVRIAKRFASRENLFQEA